MIDVGGYCKASPLLQDGDGVIASSTEKDLFASESTVINAAISEFSTQTFSKDLTEEQVLIEVKPSAQPAPQQNLKEGKTIKSSTQKKTRRKAPRNEIDDIFGF
ncbi:hypothetical protein CVT24_007025 [Panaeolus cyanescens]|uniref:Uncharacterized protein n=1 Tax=Panaeolus cyanescens TaxID=181874 RepID=A0A409YKD0_9AGAR|nr:hypothetical protein CVT24_007025 [Panaeolus cyanescens]